MEIRSGWEIKTDYRETIDAILETKILPRQIDVALLGIAIGINNDRYDEVTGEQNLSIPYSVLNSSDILQTIESLYHTAVLTTSESKKIFDEHERLQLAFDPEYEIEGFSKSKFLQGFSSFGIKHLCEKIFNKEENVFYDNLKIYLENELTNIHSKNLILNELD